MLFNKYINKSVEKIYSLDSFSAILFAVFNIFIISFAPIIIRKLGAPDFWMGVMSSAPVAGSIFIFLWLNLAFSVEKFKGTLKNPINNIAI